MDAIIGGLFGLIFTLLIATIYLLWRMMKVLNKMKEGVERVQEGVDNLLTGVKQLTITTYLLLCEQYNLSLEERINLGKELDISEGIMRLALKDQKLLQLPSPENSSK